MEPNDPVAADLARRLDRLEKRDRRWRMLALTLLLLLAATLLTGARPDDLPAPDTLRVRTVEAQTFVLRDSHGAVRGRMALGPHGAQLTFYDDDGKVTSTTPPPSGFLEVVPSPR